MMSHPVIPAPVRYEGGGQPFPFRSGVGVACADAGVAPIVEWFSAEVARRTGLHLRRIAGLAPPDAPAITTELGAGDGLGVLPASAGLSPAADRADERHSLAIDEDRVVVRAVEPVGIARGLTTLLQLLVASPSAGRGAIRVPGGRILDGPRYAWRGLSLDLARTFFTLDEVRRVIDLLALYKLNVLHLHLTDDQSWRLPVGRSGGSPPSDAAFYSADDLHALVAYAADRFVTVVPEVDTPGHTAALVRMHPALATGRNEVAFELPPGHTHRTAWLDPELPATFALVEEVLAGVAGIFPGPYVHIGGDEPHGMPHDLYTAYVRRAREIVRGIGRRPLGWQEAARAGLGPDDVIQYWFTDIALGASLPAEVRARLDADVARSREDVDAAVAASVPVIVSPLSHCYLDVPYADPPADPSQADRQRRVGLRLYPRTTVEASFDWEPAATLGPGRSAHVAGVEAAVWAETITGFDDLCFLLLPRLPGVAQRAWSDPEGGMVWPDHRARLAGHGRLWTQDDLTYFRTSAVDWR
jgi:hexosaminidase